MDHPCDSAVVPVSRELTNAEREFIGDLSPDERVILEMLQTEQRAYDNLLAYGRITGYDRSISWAWGYLRDSIKNLTLEEIQAIQRGLDRALKEIRP